MVRDTALFPGEAIRLAALGILAQKPRAYADLAAEVRQFTSRVMGPSLDLMGSSLELLRYEGLIETTTPAATATYTPPDAEIRITEAGRAEMLTLLASPMRGPINDLNKLVIALKLRFLHLLDPEERRAQIDMMSELCETDYARLIDLRERLRAQKTPLLDWIDQDLALLRERLDWFRKIRDEV